MKFLILSLALLILPATATLHGLPSQIILLRHAEKMDQSNSLTTKGKERAAALAPYLTETNTFLTYGLPVAIYAMAAPSGESSMRAIETMTPLATRLKLTLIDSFDRDSYKKMVEDIKKNPAYHGKNIVICWDSALIPDIARAFAALQTPSRWTNEIYDRVWLITFSAGGKAAFQNIPQRLLFGDTQN